MSCRRGEHARLVGCHLGPSAIRGCGRGCCPYSVPYVDSEGKTQESYPREVIESEERVSYYPSTLYGNPKHVSFLDPDSVNHRPCRHNFRPKFVCVPCRRMFKHVVHPTHDYTLREFDNTYYWRHKLDFAEERAVLEVDDREYAKLWQTRLDVLARPEMYSRERLEELKKRDPWLWMPVGPLRCPGCGSDGRLVGGAFRPPPMSDEKAWAETSRLLDAGEPFLPCPPPDKHDELIVEGQRLKAHDMQRDEWAKAKQERIAALKNAVQRGGRTPEEEAKLARIRELKEVDSKMAEWDAVSVSEFSTVSSWVDVES